MAAEHGQILYRNVATLDRSHPSYASTDPRAPLVISMDSPAVGKVTIERGRFPFNNRYRLSGSTPQLTIIGSDVRRGHSVIFEVASPEIDSVSACSDVTILADPSTRTTLRSGAQAFPK